MLKRTREGWKDIPVFPKMKGEKIIDPKPSKIISSVEPAQQQGEGNDGKN